MTALAACIAVGICARLVDRCRSGSTRETQNGWLHVSLEREHDEPQRAIGTRAEIRYLAGLRQPVTFGVRRPIVLLPDSLRAQALHVQRAVLATS